MNYQEQEDYYNKQLIRLRENALQAGLSIVPIINDDLFPEPPRKMQKITEGEIIQNSLTTLSAANYQHQINRQKNK